MHGGRARLCALRRRIHDEGPVGDRPYHDCLFEETPEEEAAELRTTPVEPEGKLVKIALEVVGLYGSLMGAEQPPLGGWQRGAFRVGGHAP